jgi:hypothetical protein
MGYNPSNETVRCGTLTATSSRTGTAERLLTTILP